MPVLLVIIAEKGLVMPITAAAEAAGASAAAVAATTISTAAAPGASTSAMKTPATTGAAAGTAVETSAIISGGVAATLVMKTTTAPAGIPGVWRTGKLRAAVVERSSVRRCLAMDDVIIVPAYRRMILRRARRRLDVNGLIPIVRVPFVHMIVPICARVSGMVVPIIGPGIDLVVSHMIIPICTGIAGVGVTDVLAARMTPMIAGL